MAVPGTARLAPDGEPAAEQAPSRLWVPLGSCDATASGSEDAQVRLARNLGELAFCHHHYSALEFVLAAAGWQVTHDFRKSLTGA